MFAIGDKEWPGVSKLVEETGELQQVLGKLMGSRGDIDHWSGNLRDKLHEELGDVLAACRFLIDHCDLDERTILNQFSTKYQVFTQWHVAEE